MSFCKTLCVWDQNLVLNNVIIKASFYNALFTIHWFVPLIHILKWVLIRWQITKNAPSRISFFFLSPSILFKTTFSTANYSYRYKSISSFVEFSFHLLMLTMFSWLCTPNHHNNFCKYFTPPPPPTYFYDLFKCKV